MHSPLVPFCDKSLLCDVSVELCIWNIFFVMQSSIILAVSIVVKNNIGAPGDVQKPPSKQVPFLLKSSKGNRCGRYSPPSRFHWRAQGVVWSG